MSASERLVEADNEFLGRCNFLDHSSQLLRILRAVPVGDVDPLGLRAAYPLPVQLPQSLHRPFPATHLVEDGDMPGFISRSRGFSCSMVPSVAVTPDSRPVRRRNIRSSTVKIRTDYPGPAPARHRFVQVQSGLPIVGGPAQEKTNTKPSAHGIQHPHLPLGGIPPSGLEQPANRRPRCR